MLSGNKSQHAFRKFYSCEALLTTVLNDWAKQMSYTIGGKHRNADICFSLLQI